MPDPAPDPAPEPVANPLDIVSTEPAVQPAVPEKIYDLWRIASLSGNWPSPTAPFTLNTVFNNARRPVADGPLEDGPASPNYFIDNLWTEAAADPEVAQVVYLLTKLLEKKARAKGVIK